MEDAQPETPVAPAGEPTAAAQEQPAVEAEAPRATRRRRATRPAAAAAVTEEPAAAVTEAPAAVVEAAVAEEQPTAPVEETPAAEEPAVAPRATTRRRRATRPVAAAEPTPAADDDPIAAALRAAEDLAEARKAVLTDPFMTAEARDAQLAALAGAIAGDTAADDEDDEDEDETAEADSDESTGDEADENGDTDDSDSDDDSDDESTDDEDSDEDRPVRRRRRRGGRRRRRSGRDDDSSDSGDGDSDDDSDNGDNGDEHASDDESADDNGDSHGTDDSSSDGDGVNRRRRRRRRRSEGGTGDSSSDDEVTGIEGSTRMEAKRQRRKESRAAGRRRAPILSEAEFLARREAVDRKLIIRQSEDYTQLAVIEDDILVEHYVDKASATSLIGNIYVGKVQNVLPSMEAAFIDIGRGRNAVLYAGEVDWAAFGVTGEHRKVENVLKSGQSVLVQVTKDPVGAKGARLTSHISLPGRYVVYSPGGHLSGISRKLPDVERNRLRNVLGHLISEDESVIVRTAAEGASEDELVRDVNRLKAQWEVIEKKSKTGGAPQALYAEPDLTLRIVRDLFTEDFGALVIQGNREQDDAFDAISAYVGHVAPQLADRLQRYEVAEDGKDVFARYRIDEQIAKALDRKVYLPSGGSLVIDRTEAMTVIDVNTGRFTGSGGNLEATVTSNNLEAAEEIVRQLRLRDIGGIIVIDFIDMVLPSNRELLLRRLVECLGRDRTRHQVAEVTSLGLVQLTRKRIGTGLAEAFTETCDHCHGAGYLRFDEPVDSQAPADGGERRGARRRRK
ncbi:Rne/Rng family ribonuclease [Tessaracoccus defluvii]|uniref:Rne/Rng family ribonuclease n=1 Tax=Tessaracoccus defluvii TaxID=1285901 RepID=UPI0029FED8EB|nr:Rne/Rng family ribonuclease [Tessaracoccus defluvii]